MDWTQVLTILAGNIGIILWTSRQSRTDFLHLDKKLDENRKESQQLIRAIQEEMKEFHTKLALQDQEFKMRLCAIEEARNHVK